MAAPPRRPTPPGLVLVDKPAGITSHTAVAQVRRALGVRKAGHSGTLDPAATGLLLVGTGAGTRLLTFLVGLDKTYEATIRLGVATTTDDAEGEVTSAQGCPPDTEVAGVCADFTGRQGQRPSAVSAVKVAGRRAYQRVRAGEQVALPEREITVSSLVVLGVEPGTAAGVPVMDVAVVAHVSSGTYVRALARDIGSRLGTGGHLTALRRTGIGPFRVGAARPPQSVSPDDVLPLGAAAAAVLPTVRISPPDAHRVGHGVRLPCAEPDQDVALLDAATGRLLAVARCTDGEWHYLYVVLPEPGSGTL